MHTKIKAGRGRDKGTRVFVQALLVAALQSRNVLESNLKTANCP